ncbi:MAG: mucoidy inhibitor MuiA family protein, partial [Candidatus Omnitrophica bacterium]|nr:mucoidy inhibitor MuiA family protein [Candidatus Omnitrophota bacterium]
MRKIMLVIVFVFIIVFPLLASEVEADAKISRVVVYPGHALVTWSAKVSLTAGEWKVIFPNIIPNIDTNSLRAKGEGTAVTRILGAQLRQEILRDNPVERIKQLQDEIQNIEDQNRKLANNKEVLSQGKSFLDSIRLFSGEQIPKDLVTKVPSAQELENTLKFLDSKLKENYSLVLDTDLALRENQKKQSVLRRELSQISGPVGKTKRSIVVEIEVIKPGDLNLDVSYLAKGANWEPFYDVRANFDKGEVELISYGKLRQRSGEDWLDSEIYLSTAMINLSGRMPEAKSWIIQPQQPRAVLSKRKSYTEHEAYDKVFEVNKEVAIDSDGRAGSLAQSTPAENLYAQAQEKGVSVV